MSISSLPVTRAIVALATLGVVLFTLIIAVFATKNGNNASATSTTAVGVNVEDSENPQCSLIIDDVKTSPINQHDDSLLIRLLVRNNGEIPLVLCEDRQLMSVKIGGRECTRFITSFDDGNSDYPLPLSVIALQPKEENFVDVTVYKVGPKLDLSPIKIILFFKPAEQTHNPAYSPQSVVCNFLG